MIACHDSVAAYGIANHFGGWSNIFKKVQSEFPDIHVSSDPMSPNNKGQLLQISQLMCSIYEHFKEQPEMMLPIMNGLVRQKGEIESIPEHLHHHMTGGLHHAILDVGMIGYFTSHPFLYVIGAKELPDRNHHSAADGKLMEALKDLYRAYLEQG